MSRPSLMIFAAGFGRRMGSLSKDTPKPMLPLEDAPMIDKAIALGREAQASKIVANTHYLSEKIEPHLKKQDVTVLHEFPDILDTGGGLKSAQRHLTTPTWTLNPDVLWEGPNPLELLLGHWQITDSALLLVAPLERTRNRHGPGDFRIERGKLVREGDLVFTGAQLIRTEPLDDIMDTVFSLNKVWDQLATRGKLRGIVYPGTWHDAGTPDGLAAANAHLRSTHV